MARELDDALLHLRLNEPDLGLLVFRTEGDPNARARRRRAADRARPGLAGPGNHAAAEARVQAGGHDRAQPDHADRGRILLRRKPRRTCLRRRPRGDADRRGDVASVAAEFRPAADGQRPHPPRDPLPRRTRQRRQRPRPRSAKPLDADTADALGLITAAYDDIDWDDEVRLLLEERASFSADALTGLEANLRFPGPETMETRIFGRLTAWQNWIFQRPNAVGDNGSLKRYGTGERPTFDPAQGLTNRRIQESASMPDSIAIDYDGLIPNNVGLADDLRVRRALETWHPGYIDWWKTMGPEGFQNSPVFLRTAVGVGSDNWAKFDFVRMPEYRWGILLAPQIEGRTIPFGAHKGEPAWQEVPGEYRAMLRRLLVIQGDTEPASVEQQRHLGATAPSLYDLRNLFQVNVEEGRHLWAMVYLLQKYFGRDGREEAEELLKRRSGDTDSPRMLGAFNERTPDWLSFFMFTFFTDRDGKMQLAALAQSGFDPLSRTCRFMLTEEAHHMYVGETGVTAGHPTHLRGDESRRHHRPVRHRTRRALWA